MFDSLNYMPMYMWYINSCLGELCMLKKNAINV